MNGDSPPRTDVSRRRFLQTVAGASAGVGMFGWQRLAAATEAGSSPPAVPLAASPATTPWFTRTLRWGQTNLTEADPARFDLAWWRRYWKETAIQGVVVNAGGIVAFYPTEIPFHRRAATLGDRDLFGELTRAAHEDGLAVFARMDSNRADDALLRAHPDWFARDAEGKPYLANDLAIACVNGPYYEEHIPAILREVATRYRPEGFTDNNWNGPMRHQPCFCANCERKFRGRTGEAIPRRADWHSPLYRDWIVWNYERRLEIWDTFNRITRDAGGPECIWVGMMAGSLDWQARVFRDDREIYRRTELIMLDHQRRYESEGFQHNSETGLRLHCVGGWDKVIPESTALYQLGDHNFRLAARPEPEVRLWQQDAMAGGIQPWWHHIGGDQQDLRQLRHTTALWRWHRDHEEFLVHRRPVATVGLAWTQRNMDFFGRDDSGPQVGDPWNGFTQALVRARIPYVPVHLDDLERVTAELGLRLLVLPNLAAMSDAQVAGVRRFVEGGGSLLATGASSLCNEWGDSRADFALADVLQVNLPAGHALFDEEKRLRWARDWSTTYLHLEPEQRLRHDGPRTGAEPPATGERHEVLRGFEETDLLAFGGMLEPLTVGAGALVPLTFVPALPPAPVESAWLREPRTSIPGLVLSEHAAGGRVAYLPADLDRRFARDNLPDHGDLLANLVRWTLRNQLPLRIEGPGLLDARLYQQPGRLILHLVNLTNAGTWRAPVHELIAVGPHELTIELPQGIALRTIRSLVTGNVLEPRASAGDSGTVRFRLDSILDHEVLVIG